VVSGKKYLFCKGNMAQFFHKNKKEKLYGGFNRFGTASMIGLYFFWIQNAQYPDKVMLVYLWLHRYCSDMLVCVLHNYLSGINSVRYIFEGRDLAALLAILPLSRA